MIIKVIKVIWNGLIALTMCTVFKDGMQIRKQIIKGLEQIVYILIHVIEKIINYVGSIK